MAFLDRASHSRIHGDFLKDRPTASSLSPDPFEEWLGDLRIRGSGDRGGRNREVEFAQELALYLILGWLHLVGFDDKAEDRKSCAGRNGRSSTLSKILGLG